MVASTTYLLNVFLVPYSLESRKEHFAEDEWQIEQQ
jgi:hypothetical protein